jgi:hypothetical protein
MKWKNKRPVSIKTDKVKLEDPHYRSNTSRLSQDVPDIEAPLVGERVKMTDCGQLKLVDSDHGRDGATP